MWLLAIAAVAIGTAASPERLHLAGWSRWFELDGKLEIVPGGAIRMIWLVPVINGVLARDTVLNGTYRIDHRIDGGAMGTVYCGINVRLPGRPLAIKVLVSAAGHAIPNAVERFRQEAEILSELDHPNIVQIFDFFDGAASSIGVPYLVMQYVAGENLWRKTSQGQRLPLDAVLPIAGQLSSALLAVHAKGIIHRDLKPHNVVLARRTGETRETVKLLDFGIAKLRTAMTELTRARTTLGTPRYLSPELAAGEREIDARSDQFSLAAIIYGLIAGRPAFPGEDDSVVLNNIRSRQPDPLGPSVHATEQVLLRALDKDKGNRFRDVDEFYKELEFAARVDRQTKAIEPTKPIELTELIDIPEGGPGQGASPVSGGTQPPPLLAALVAPPTPPGVRQKEKPDATVPLVAPASPGVSSPIADSDLRLAPTTPAPIPVSGLTERKRASSRLKRRTTGKLPTTRTGPLGLVQPEPSRRWLLWVLGVPAVGIAGLLAYGLSGSGQSSPSPPAVIPIPDEPASWPEPPLLAQPNSYPPALEKVGAEAQAAAPVPSRASSPAPARNPETALPLGPSVPGASSANASRTGRAANRAPQKPRPSRELTTKSFLKRFGDK